ncbi:maleylpyruvate isomerase N-terminal domain-containing protein [Allorhizocola rhizosphaerae]|uniref:maleylpyruvate isomerase N-terminal domain-containing protein n=1 Tax=Allorhizocola rhizosphaerae TaxID=1872709 RepID=UPI000E3D582A|nr:maleylpyruvate isomerase N-terminal domain-containing protein [Allorhizocola rhizosphaerae]
METELAIELCLAAHRRLEERIAGLTDDVALRPSRLPDWTVGHVLTHLARNAEGHSMRLAGALRGEEVQRYPGGAEQRDADIESGSSRSSEELVRDVTDTNRRLEAVWRESVEAGWPHSDLMAGDRWSTVDSPNRRLREVEIHHYDLGLGYEPAEWSDEYADWELHRVLEGLPSRLDGAQKRQVVAWLTGRDPLPADFTVGEWG